MPSTSNNHNVCVVGGGTGSYVTISALHQITSNIHAIIAVADSGGSTGRLRDEFGFLPVGDLRQALAALASNKDQEWIRKLLLYRYAKGSGLEGHNLGNLILTALQDMTDSTAEALEKAAHIFRLKGSVYPATTDNIQLVIEYQDGTTIIGEHHLDDSKLGGKKIQNVKTSPRARMCSKAKSAIIKADTIIVSPGDLYASILPNFAIEDANHAIKQSKARFVVILNLMTRYTQTHEMTAADHINELVKYAGRKPDIVIVNSQEIPDQIAARYQKENEYPVVDDLEESQGYRIIRTPLITTTPVKKHSADAVPRSFLRHDPNKLAKVLKTLLYEN